MYGSGLYGEFVYGEPATAELDIDQGILIYNNYSLDSDNVRLSNLPDIFSNTNIQMNTYKTAYTNWEGFDSYFLQNKKIVIDCVLTTDWWPEDFEQLISSLKGSLLQYGKQFKWTRRDWVVLTTTAYCSDLSFNWKSHNLTFVEASLEFTILDPFFYREDSSEALEAWVTADYQGTVQYTWGEYEAEPVISFTFNSATSVDEVKFTMNGATITVNESISADDVLLIDCKNKDISLNSDKWKDYVWVFPTIPLGEIPYDVEINGTYNVDVAITRNNTYA